MNKKIIEGLQELMLAPAILEKKETKGKDLDKKLKNEPEEVSDTLEVFYADVKNKKFECVFSKIILITNSRDAKDNKTLKVLIDSTKKFKNTELFVFVAEEISFDDDGNKITIKDDETTLTLENESNVDTLIITRLGAQGEYNCEHLISTLQDWGFLVLNPIKPAKLASNKYETAVVLEKAKLPQPRFCLVTKENTEDVDTFNKLCRGIFPEENEDNPYVCKILDGHGGTGVFMAKEKQLMAVLQTIFAVNPEVELILQDKKEGDGGDLRIHVLTLRNKQVIVGAMKRKKMGKDFRSNISLGAVAEKVILTKEQEQIALKAAAVSGLPWCAVDIMPLVKGSDKLDGLDDVILELNSSPGTEGITEVLGVNFMSLLLHELSDPSEFFIQDKVAGFRESIEVTIGDTEHSLLATLDTGCGVGACTLGVDEKTVHTNNKITFIIGKKEYTLDRVKTVNAKVGNETEERDVVSIPEIKIGKRVLRNVLCAIKDDRKKTTNFLVNRDTLSRLGFVVSSNSTHLLTPEKEILKYK